MLRLLSGENSSSPNGNNICFLYGKTNLFDGATLHALYPDHDSYVANVTNATKDAVDKGFLMNEDAQLIVEAAQRANVP